ncbi:MAG: hypothetical protein FWB84_08595 [Candidatus Bathyarchaeota archaeon]|uniref:winged helix-turn-helix domain-containing protein n=1 Tax=Candidatus Bathycorpusculum sp. TaxID=2994959 RepID=UPI0028306CCE|nr:hypothetical protein [Candidatus Termiticorpusculum sp.]MCL2258192.1 hypothetical protein [Candidatus Termiticorpusculum sp.]MCL2291454.1 hypothetical protein [Candidatus Termiticorpusculum sp.]
MGAIPFNAVDWLDVFPALDNTERFNLLIDLANNGQKSFAEIKKDSGLPSSSVEHHLTKLMDAQLIVNDYQVPLKPGRAYSYYKITSRGKDILDILLKST